MTKPKIVFDPFSEEFFNNPFEIYRRMREEAPLYYDENEDFYALTRHEDVCGAAANRDPDAFTDAEVFDIERNQTEAQHLGLGYGIHSCLGAALARLESRIALERLLDFMPRYEVNWDGLQRVHMQNVAGHQNVPAQVVR
jgi:cytochrome P450